LCGGYFLPGLRKHGWSPTSRRFLNDIVGLGIELKVGILARQPVRHPALGVIEFRDDQARIIPHLLPRRPPEVGTPDHGFGQINGVVNDDSPGQKLTVTMEVLRQFRFVATGYAIAPDPASFQMRGGDFQDLPEPLSS
jgi:hypothetical protein